MVNVSLVGGTHGVHRDDVILISETVANGRSGFAEVQVRGRSRESLSYCGIGDGCDQSSGDDDLSRDRILVDERLPGDWLTACRPIIRIIGVVGTGCSGRSGWSRRRKGH